VVTDALGNKVEDIFYKPFGEAISDTGVLSMNHKYTGQEMDQELDLYNYNARLYDPVVGKFVSADTVVQDLAASQSYNRYSYVTNNPLIYVDPSGNVSISFEISPGGGGVGGMGNMDGQPDWNPPPPSRKKKSAQSSKKSSPAPKSTSATVLNSSTSYTYGVQNNQQASSCLLIGTVDRSSLPSASEVMHGLLGGAGLTPLLGVFPDLIDAGLYAYEGDSSGVAWALGAAIPLEGLGVRGVQLFGKVNRHHSFPKFLGGWSNQTYMSQLPANIHKEFHSLLGRNIKKAGFPLGDRGRNGSKILWTRYMSQHSGAQRQALDVVFDTARDVDMRYGTSITPDLWKTIFKGEFEAY